MTPSSSERPAARLYIAEPLAAGALVPLPDEAVHRLRNVLRLAAGATVAAFNERDGEFLCRIETLRRSYGTLQAIEQRRAPEPGPDVWLVFAPIKRARLDWLVEKATELGAAALVPVVTARTQPERINRERLRIITVAAAEQSERLSLPEIRPEVPLARLLAEWPAGRRPFPCDESGTGPPIAAALAGFDGTAPGTVPGMAPGMVPGAVFIGPEGGFAETELDALGKLSIV